MPPPRTHASASVVAIAIVAACTSVPEPADVDAFLSQPLVEVSGTTTDFGFALAVAPGMRRGSPSSWNNAHRPAPVVVMLAVSESATPTDPAQAASLVTGIDGGLLVRTAATEDGFSVLKVSPDSTRIEAVAWKRVGDGALECDAMAVLRAPSTDEAAATALWLEGLCAGLRGHAR